MKVIQKTKWNIERGSNLEKAEGSEFCSVHN